MGSSQGKVRELKKIKLILLTLAILIILLILGKTTSLVTSISTPFSTKSALFKNIKRDHKTNLNLIVAYLKDKDKTAISVLSYSPKDKKITILNLSDQIYLELPKDFGSWQISSIYPLGQQENPKIGAKLLQLSVYKLLGVPIDGILMVSDPELAKKPQKLISRLKVNPLNIFGSMSTFDSNLGAFQKFNYLWAISKVRQDKIISLDLAQSSITESKLLPDSTRVLGIDSYKMDYYIRQNMVDEVFLDEGLSVAVYNSTEFPGMANLASRIITNMGGNVVFTGTTQEHRKTSGIFINTNDITSAKDSSTTQRLTQIFAPDCAGTPCITDDPKIHSSRAAVNIVLGKDFFDFWYYR